MAKAKGGDVVKGSNEIQIYDFETGLMRSVFRKIMENNQVRTISQGLSEFLPDGGIFVEETDSGRLLAFDSDGNLTWEYVNRSSDGELNLLNWSRIIPNELALSVLQAVASEKCE